MKKNVENCCIQSKEYIIFTSSNNNKTHTTMEIIITEQIEKEINAEIKKISDRIEKEMNISWDLRNYELIEMDAKYIKEMKESLRKGVL